MAHLERSLRYLTADLEEARFSQRELSTLSDCLVILGEPGMGKSSLLEDLATNGDGSVCTARQLINRPDPRSLLGNKDVLIIDALDEVAARAAGDAVDLVLQKLGLLGYPRFILSCRVADWRAATSVEAIREQYGSAPLELHLDPLDKGQQRALLTSEVGNEQRAEELLRHFETFQLDFLGNPQTLQMIARLPVGVQLPKTSSRLFELATDVMRREHKDAKAHRELPRESGLDAAGAAFAALILTANSRIIRKASANLAEGEISFSDVDQLATGHLESVIATRLFKGSSNSFTYWHRRIGEYLGARWLAKSADTPEKRKRLLAIFRSEGLVPANLRGMHAWLALDSHLASHVIDTDPVGLIEYGDADSLSADLATQLLERVEQLARNNPRLLGWGPYRAASLIASPLSRLTREIIQDRNRNPGIRRLLLQQIKRSNVVSDFRDDLLSLMRNPSEDYFIRELAGEALISESAFDWPKELEDIRRLADYDSIRLAYNLMTSVGFEPFSDIEIVEAVFAHDGLSLCPFPQGEPDRSLAGFWKIAPNIPYDRLDTLLDTITEYVAALLPKHANYSEHELIDLVYQLILKRLELDPPTPERLWSWLSPFEDQRSYHRARREQLADWFARHSHIRQAIQALYILPERDPGKFRRRAFDLGDASRGLAFNQSDVIAILDKLDPEDRQDERWREIIWFAPREGDEGEPLRSAAKRFAKHRPDLIQWIDDLANPEEPLWKQKEERERRKRKADRAMTHAEHRKEFSANIAEMRAGGFRYLHSPARAYLGHFRDIGEDEPAHLRVSEWLGEELSAAAFEGFDAFLRATPARPNATYVAISLAQGRKWYATDIIVVGLAERLRTRGPTFETISSERLATGLFELWHSQIERHAKIDGLTRAIEKELIHRGDFSCSARLYFEPQFKKRVRHISHLYAFMREDFYENDLRLDLAAEWLSRFPNMSHESEIELVDALLSGGRYAALAELAQTRLAQNLDGARRLDWDAVQVIVDFENAKHRLAKITSEPALLWHVRSRAGSRRLDDRASTLLSPAQIEWIVSTFRRAFPACDPPSGVRSGDDNPWDATQYIYGLGARLGSDTSDDAQESLCRLRDAAEDGYTKSFRIYAAEQLQARAEQRYVAPTLAEIKAIIESGRPQTASDLQAMLLDALANAQRRLKGDPLNWYKNFFRADDRHKDEEECRDALLQMLDQKIDSVALRPEEHMADHKRVDIIADAGSGLILPIEVKGQWHRHLWTAADTQLDHLYVNDYRAELGIYLVLWFGVDTELQKPPAGLPSPGSPAELKAALEKFSGAAATGRVAIEVLDLTRPRNEHPQA